MCRRACDIILGHVYRSKYGCYTCEFSSDYLEETPVCKERKTQTPHCKTGRQSCDLFTMRWWLWPLFSCAHSNLASKNMFILAEHFFIISAVFNRALLKLLFLHHMLPVTRDNQFRAQKMSFHPLNQDVTESCSVCSSPETAINFGAII